MKRLLCVLLVAVMILGLCACGPNEDEILGTWTIDSVEVNGSSFTIDELEAMGDYSLSDVQLVVKAGGQAYMTADGEGTMVEWEKTPSGIKIGIRDCEIENGLLCASDDEKKMFLKKTSDSQIIQPPSERPSVEPSEEPSEMPTPEPTETPTPEPSAEPSPEFFPFEIGGLELSIPSYYESVDLGNDDGIIWFDSPGVRTRLGLLCQEDVLNEHLFEVFTESIISSASDSEGSEILESSEYADLSPGLSYKRVTVNMPISGMKTKVYYTSIYNENSESAIVMTMARYSNAHIDYVDDYNKIIETASLVSGKSPDKPQTIDTVSGDLGDHHVEIKEASLTTSYDDRPVIVITYAWTNNSEKTTNASSTFNETAYQDGIELDSVIFLSDDTYDLLASTKNIRPGATIDVQNAYYLDSETSTVEFELSEWFSYDDDPIVVTFDLSSLS